MKSKNITRIKKYSGFKFRVHKFWAGSKHFLRAQLAFEKKKKQWPVFVCDVNLEKQGLDRLRLFPDDKQWPVYVS